MKKEKPSAWRLWERLPGESDAEYARFTRWLLSRSEMAWPVFCRAAHLPEHEARELRAMRGWDDRAAAWDARLAGVEIGAKLADVEDQEAAVERRRARAAQSRMLARTVLNLEASGALLERREVLTLTRDLPKANRDDDRSRDVVIATPARDLTRLSREELRALEALERKALGDGW